MDIIRQRTTHDELKSVFESYDKDCLGTLTVLIISQRYQAFYLNIMMLFITNLLVMYIKVQWENKH